MAKRLTTNDTISNVYYVKEGFGSVQETLKKAKIERPINQYSRCKTIYGKTTEQTD